MKTTTHLLLDIEGTTCPITFVSDVLYSYAKEELSEFILNHRDQPSMQALLNETWKEWHNDPDPASQNLLKAAHTDHDNTNHRAITQYLEHLISTDRKSTPLKDLQGKIWKEGYESGRIKTTLFPETTRMLRTWRDKGLQLAVYSSGSVTAQQLLFRYTNEGDIRSLFCGWFDTHTGNKKDADSYRLISEALNTAPSDITFISDSQAECNAAAEAGLSTLFSLRPGNPHQDPGGHRVISVLDEVMAMLN